MSRILFLNIVDGNRSIKVVGVAYRWDRWCFALPGRTLIMNKKNRKKRAKLRAKREKYSVETRGAEWITIGWMLAAVTTLATELGGLAAFGLAGDSEAAMLFSRYMMFAAIVIGTISALLTLGVYRIRSVPPPRAVTTVLLIIVLTPLPLWYLLFER